MNKLLITLPALILALGGGAASAAGAGTAKSGAAASAAHGDAAASKPARKAGKVAQVPNSAASANQAGVGPKAGGEQGKGPPKQMKKTEAESNSSQ